MAFHLPLFFSLLKMAVVVALASQDAHPPLPHELYWNSVLPNTQMPKAISQLLQPDFMIKEDMRIPVELGKGTGFDIYASMSGMFRPIFSNKIDIMKPTYVGVAQEENIFLYPSHHTHATHGGTNVDRVGKDGTKPAYVGVAQEGNIFLYPSQHAHATHGDTNVNLVGKNGTKPAYVGVAQEGNIFLYPSHHAHATHGGTNVDLVGKDRTKPAYVGVAQKGNIYVSFTLVIMHMPLMRINSIKMTTHMQLYSCWRRTCVLGHQ